MFFFINTWKSYPKKNKLISKNLINLKLSNHNVIVYLQVVFFFWNWFKINLID